MASLVRALALDELVEAADQVVVADVLSVQSAWDESHRVIHTTVEMEIRENWKGASPESGHMSIRQLGGTVGEIEMTVHGMPKFRVGERSLLFLRHSQVVGMSQGKRNLRKDDASHRWLVDPADRSEVVNVVAGGKLHAVGPERVDDLDGLRARILRMVGR